MNHNLKLRQVNPLPLVKKIFALALSLLSLYLLYSGTFFGLVLLGAAIKLGTREGIEIALEGRVYRKVYVILGITIGSWKELPPIDYISVFKTTKKSRARVIAAQADLGFQVYRLNLFYETNKHIVAYETEEKEKAFKVADHISMVLNTTINDAT